jgi:hypothetical protein
MGKSMEIYIPIISEFVSKTIVSPMAIAEQNKLASVIKDYGFCPLVGPGKSAIGRHLLNFDKYPKNMLTPKQTTSK